MANVFIILRDEKKSPEIKRRQIPLQSLHDLKAFSSECDKNLMVNSLDDKNICQLNAIAGENVNSMFEKNLNL